MSLIIKLHPNGSALLAESEHGSSVPLPRDLADVGGALLALLRKQAEPKVVAQGVDGDVLTLVLADWERVGRMGDGRGIHRKERNTAPSACPHCDGTGWDAASPRSDDCEVPCNRCAGTGTLIRIITKTGKELLPL